MNTQAKKPHELLLSASWRIRKANVVNISLSLKA